MGYALQSAYELSAWMLFVALLFDGLDGRVARLTHTTSNFGVEFDSLADIVSFGVAPSLLIYLYAGESFGRLGLVVSALYVTFGAIRLARFNVMNATSEPSVFIGIPIPTAAVVLAVMVLLFEKYTLNYYAFMLFVMMAVSLLMVSNIRYPSFKKADKLSIHYRRALIVVALLVSVIVMHPIEGLALLFALYLLYGPLRAIYKIYYRYRKN